MIYLCIAGHGPGRNGAFDPGATGHITKGEYRYMKEDLFPAMKKYADDKFVFFDEYDVFAHRNIVALARRYGVNVAVIEFHFDATGSPDATGGHVIVYSHYKPDVMDLRLRDAIEEMVGVRYSHAGHTGISGRSNLFNVNAAASGRVNYRLVELGFGTNKHDADILVNRVDEYAKKLVEAIKDNKVTPSTSTPIKPSKPKPKPKPSPTSSKSKWTEVTGDWTGQTLRQGHYGKPVRQMQEMLSAKYYYPDKGSHNNGIDGYFGAKTKDAVERYQSMHGLTIDGLPGKSTYASLKGVKASKPEPKPKPEPQPQWTEVTGNWTGQTLRRGQYGKPIRQLQEMLAAKYYYPDVDANNKGIDSYFGADTENAVRRYQSMHSLTVDGLPGRATYNSLK